MNALIERSAMVSIANGGLFKQKKSAAVVVVRQVGAVRTFDTVNHLLQHAQMIIVGSTHWNLSIRRDPGQVKDDAEGIQTMQTLGKDMAWVMKMPYS